MNKKQVTVILTMLMGLISTTAFAHSVQENNNASLIASCNGECQQNGATLGDGDRDR